MVKYIFDLKDLLYLIAFDKSSENTSIILTKEDKIKLINVLIQRFNGIISLITSNNEWVLSCDKVQLDQDEEKSKNNIIPYNNL